MPTTPPHNAESDGVWPVYRTASVTGVSSANSGHYAAIPGTAPVLWEPAAPYADMPDAVPATMPPTPRTFLLRRTLGEHGCNPWMMYGP